MKGKTVLITGANKGIGFGIAKHLGLSGWNIIVGARHQERAEAAIRELKSQNIHVLGWVYIELADLSSISEASKEINDKYPELSLLVNNAGIPGDMSVDSKFIQPVFHQLLFCDDQNSVNVFFGQMSFVGPRPDVPGYADQLQGDDRRILQLRPGITGPASIKYRNEEELLAQQADPKWYNDNVIWPDKVKINLEYLDHWSFFGDLQLIFKTLF